MTLCVASNIYTVLLYRFFFTQIDTIDWVAVLAVFMAIFNFFNDVTYNKGHISGLIFMFIDSDFPVFMVSD